MRCTIRFFFNIELKFVSRRFFCLTFFFVYKFLDKKCTRVCTQNGLRTKKRVVYNVHTTSIEPINSSDTRKHQNNKQYDGGFLPDIILLTQCYYHRRTRLNAMKRFCIFSF